MAYTKYSLTPANNTAAPPDGAPEGMLPSAVNDTMRDMMAQIRDCGDGIRGGTYTMTAPVITGGSITGAALSGNTLTNPVITGGSINNTPIGASTRAAGSFTTVTTTNDSSISGLTVGKGGGSINSNTVLGTSALNANTTGSYNVALGYQSLLANTTGYQNVAIGYALIANTTGLNNIGVGVNSLLSNTSGGNNVAVGLDSLRSNTTASNNTAVGYQAGYSNTTGTDIVTVGYQAGLSNTTATRNTFVGRSAGSTVSTGNYNAAFGSYALQIGTGGYNTAIGDFSLNTLTTGTNNTVIGQGSGAAITTGSKNSILGAYSGNQGGLDIRTASNYIVLSDGDGNPRIVVNTSGSTLIGTTSAIYSSEKLAVSGSETGGGVGVSYFKNTATSGGDGSSPIIVTKSMTTTTSSARFMQFYANNLAQPMGGIVGNGAENVQFLTLSDEREKENIKPVEGALNRIMQLQVSSFNRKGSNEFVPSGFIAQNVLPVYPEYVVENAANEGKEQRYGITGGMSAGYIAELTAAIQELKAEVDSLKQQLGK